MFFFMCRMGWNCIVVQAKNKVEARRKAREEFVRRVPYVVAWGEWSTLTIPKARRIRVRRASPNYAGGFSGWQEWDE